MKDLHFVNRVFVLCSIYIMLPGCGFLVIQQVWLSHSYTKHHFPTHTPDTIFSATYQTPVSHPYCSRNLLTHTPIQFYQSFNTAPFPALQHLCNFEQLNLDFFGTRWWSNSSWRWTHSKLYSCLLPWQRSPEAMMSSSPRKSSRWVPKHRKSILERKLFNNIGLISVVHCCHGYSPTPNRESDRRSDSRRPSSETKTGSFRNRLSSSGNKPRSTGIFKSESLVSRRARLENLRRVGECSWIFLRFFLPMDGRVNWLTSPYLQPNGRDPFYECSCTRANLLEFIRPWLGDWTKSAILANSAARAKKNTANILFTFREKGEILTVGWVVEALFLYCLLRRCRCRLLCCPDSVQHNRPIPGGSCSIQRCQVERGKWVRTWNMWVMPILYVCILVSCEMSVSFQWFSHWWRAVVFRWFEELGLICELLEKASEIRPSKIKSPTGRVFQMCVYSIFMVKMRIDLGSFGLFWLILGRG